MPWTCSWQPNRASSDALCHTGYEVRGEVSRPKAHQTPKCVSESLYLGLRCPYPKLKTRFQHVCLRQPLVCFSNTHTESRNPAAGKLLKVSDTKGNGKCTNTCVDNLIFRIWGEKKLVTQHRNYSWESTYLKLDLGTKQSTAELSVRISKPGGSDTPMCTAEATHFTDLTPFTTKQK